MSQDFGVQYLLYGDKHAVVLAVSIWTLRQHYTGPVAIAAGDAAAQATAAKIAADPRAGEIIIRPWEFQGGQRGSGYHAKTFMDQHTPFDSTVFLDADTIVVGEFADLCPHGEFVKLTQFANWKSSGKKVRGRILKWRDVAPVQVARVAAHPYPAVNTGVLAYTRKAKRFMEAWRDMSARRIGFICDEIAAQLVFPEHPHNIVGDKFNWSCHHGVTPREEVSIIHLHGNGKHIRSDRCRAEWLPHFLECWREDFAGIRAWAPAGDRHLRGWMAEHAKELEGAAV